MQHQQQQQSLANLPFFGDLSPNDPRYKELLEKYKVIQKHEQYLHRQNDKHQSKVRQLHQEFVQKQRRIKEQSIVNAKNQRINANFFPVHHTRSRLVSPYELGTFERAVKNYQQETQPTRPSTTPYPITETIAAATTNRIKSSRSNVKGDISEDELERLLSTHREKIYSQLKQEEKVTRKSKVKPTKALGREDLLKQLKLALADQPELGNQNYTTMDLVLPNGEKVQVIRTTDPNLIKGATPLNAEGTILSEGSPQQLTNRDMVVEQKPLLEQVADSNILPPGSNFEVIRQSADGNLQPVGSLPNRKKVTFVYLEEQNDGSYKVQGVKSNGDKEAKTKGSEVDTIIDRIKNGEIQLPPTNRKDTIVTRSSSPSPSTAYVSNTNTIYDNNSPTTQFDSSATPSPSFSFVSSASPYSTLSTSSSEQENLLTASPSSHYPSSTTPRSVSSRSIYTTRSLSTTYSDNHISTAAHAHSQPAISASTVSQVTTPPAESTTVAQSELITILKNSGLHAMAKYLKQSGLDTM